MSFAENPKDLTLENQPPMQEAPPVGRVEIISDHNEEETEAEDARKIQEIQQKLESDAFSGSVDDTSDAMPVDSKEDRLRRLTNAAKLTAIDTFYEKSSDDFLDRLRLPKKEHIAMYEKMIADDNRALWGHNLTEKTKNWHLAHKADAEARLSEMKLERGMTRQYITDAIEKQQYQQQNGYGIFDRVKGRFQAWSLGRQLKKFDANIEQYKQEKIKEKGDFYQ